MPRAAAIGTVAPSGSPTALSTGSSRPPSAGSARNPTTSVVSVIPSWAADSSVDSPRSALTTPAAPRSPFCAASSAAPRSTVVRENSAATKNPVIAVNSTAARRSSHSVIALRMPPYGSGNDGVSKTTQGPPVGGP